MVSCIEKNWIIMNILNILLFVRLLFILLWCVDDWSGIFDCLVNWLFLFDYIILDWCWIFSLFDWFGILDSWYGGYAFCSDCSGIFDFWLIRELLFWECLEILVCLIDK